MGGGGGKKKMSRTTFYYKDGEFFFFFLGVSPFFLIGLASFILCPEFCVSMKILKKYLSGKI